jgi:hypothetical protein
MNRKWLKRIPLGLGVILFLAALYLLFDWLTAKSALRKYEEQLDASDPGWRYVEILEKYNNRIPAPDENATLLAKTVQNSLTREWTNWHNAASGEWLPNANRNQLPDPTKLAEARRVRTASQQSIDLARSIKPNMLGGEVIPFGPNPMVTINPPQAMREVFALLALDAMVAAADRDPARACTTLIACTRYARALQGEPSLISMFLQIAFVSITAQQIERVLAYCELTSPDLQQLEMAWNDIPMFEIVRLGMSSERAIGHEHFEFMKSTGAGTGMYLLSKIARGYFEREQLHVLRLATQIVELQKQPPHEWNPRVKELQLAQSAVGRPLAQLVVPAYEKCIEASIRELTRYRCTQLALAAERYRLANGNWPTSIDVLKSVGEKLDPYSGQPLRLLLTNEGVIIYSVGGDGVDNGGKFDDGNLNKPDHDFGIRLWSPQFRRQPPKPEPNAAKQ